LAASRAVRFSSTELIEKVSGPFSARPALTNLCAYCTVSLVVSVAKCLSDCGTYSTNWGTRLRISFCGTPLYVISPSTMTFPSTGNCVDSIFFRDDFPEPS
jgi:hypothetical protein